LTDERWDVPSERLKKLVALKNTPSMEPCPACPHRAHPGLNYCGIEMRAYGMEICRCTGGKK
jgi:hypothetical protein